MSSLRRTTEGTCPLGPLPLPPTPAPPKALNVLSLWVGSRGRAVFSLHLFSSSLPGRFLPWTIVSWLWAPVSLRIGSWLSNLPRSGQIDSARDSQMSVPLWAIPPLALHDLGAQALTKWWRVCVMILISLGCVLVTWQLCQHLLFWGTNEIWNTFRFKINTSPKWIMLYTLNTRICSNISICWSLLCCLVLFYIPDG